MHGPWNKSASVAREIDCQFRPGTDRIVKIRLVKGVCKVLWPENTEAHVAAICGCSVRTAARYLSDEIDAPAVLIVAITVELTKKRS
jgi:hypothetical protein